MLEDPFNAPTVRELLRVVRQLQTGTPIHVLPPPILEEDQLHLIYDELMMSDWQSRQDASEWLRENSASPWTDITIDMIMEFPYVGLADFAAPRPVPRADPTGWTPGQLGLMAESLISSGVVSLHVDILFADMTLPIVGAAMLRARQVVFPATGSSSDDWPGF